MPAHQTAWERVITVYCPDWPVTAAGCRPGDPAAVLHANRVVARTDAAAHAGVSAGQRRRQAQHRCPELRIVDADPARDAREFEPVLGVIAEMAPRFDVVEPGWVSFAARGPARYFGGEETFVERLVGVLADTGHAGVSGPSAAAAASAGIGVADGRFASAIAARLAVRRRSPVIVDAGGSTNFCAGLPVGWLSVLGECDAELVDVFVRLGLRRLGDLAALAHRDVLSRFGPVGAHVRQLATGADTRPSHSIAPTPQRTVERILDDPVVQNDTVVFVAKSLADRLVAALAADGEVCTRLVVVLETEHGERSERSWFRSAGLSAAAMVERVRWQLDGWIGLPKGSADEITSGVVLVRLVPDEVRRDEGQQLGLWGGQSDADRRAIRTLARLSTIAGEQAVTVPVWRGGRLPSERYRWVSAVTADLDARSAHVANAASVAAEPWPGSLPSPSPASVLVDPRPVEVTDADGGRVVVSGRGVLSAAPAHLVALHGDDDAGWRHGVERHIVRWAGPWLVEERWWEPELHRRQARLQIVTDDQRAHLVVAEQRRWWIVAHYD